MKIKVIITRSHFRHLKVVHDRSRDKNGLNRTTLIFSSFKTYDYVNFYKLCKRQGVEIAKNVIFTYTAFHVYFSLLERRKFFFFTLFFLTFLA